MPDGWAKRPPGQFAVDAYGVGDNIMVTLTPAGGRVDDNVNRWRQQIGLPPANANEMKTLLQDFPVAGLKGVYVDLANPKGPAEKNRTLGVILPAGDVTWFVKMMGPHDPVGRHKNDFETFVKSFKLGK